MKHKRRSHQQSIIISPKRTQHVVQYYRNSSLQTDLNIHKCTSSLHTHYIIIICILLTTYSNQSTKEHPQCRH